MTEPCSRERFKEWCDSEGGWFALDTAAGSLTNIQPYIDDVGVPQTVETLEVTALGTSSKAQFRSSR